MEGIFLMTYEATYGTFSSRKASTADVKIAAGAINARTPILPKTKWNSMNDLTRNGLMVANGEI